MTLMTPSALLNPETLKPETHNVRTWSALKSWGGGGGGRNLGLTRVWGFLESRAEVLSFDLKPQTLNPQPETPNPKWEPFWFRS